MRGGLVNHRVVWYALLLVFAAVLATLLGACERVDPCQVNPTRQASDGTWIEADGEPMDDDPCDADDVFDDHDYKPTPVIKLPEPKKTPAKLQQPVGGTKKRF